MLWKSSRRKWYLSAISRYIHVLRGRLCKTWDALLLFNSIMLFNLRLVCISSWTLWSVGNCSSIWEGRRSSQNKGQNCMLPKLCWHWTTCTRKISSTGISSQRTFWWEQTDTWKSPTLGCQKKSSRWAKRAILSVVRQNTWLQKSIRTEDTISLAIGGV